MSKTLSTVTNFYKFISLINQIQQQTVEIINRRIIIIDQNIKIVDRNKHFLFSPYVQVLITT